MDIHKNARTQPYSRALLVERMKGAWSVFDAASAAGISERRAYVWQTRPEAEAYQDRSSRPHRLPNKTAQPTIDAIVAARRERLTYREISVRLKVSVGLISKTLRAIGLNRLSLLEGPPPPVVRYEWPEPGFLHLDIKKLGKIDGVGKRIIGRRVGRHRRSGWEYLHVAVDDHSRLSYCEVLPAQDGAVAAAFLDRAVAWYQSQGVEVTRLLTDNGGSYVARTVRQACQRLAITHKRTRPYTPRTNGKAERMIQTLCREWAYRFSYSSSADRSLLLNSYLHFYNHHREHCGIARLAPMLRLNNVRERDI